VRYATFTIEASEVGSNNPTNLQLTRVSRRPYDFEETAIAGRGLDFLLYVLRNGF
jgi:hypothetical protein